MATDPDPRTAPDDDATEQSGNHGVSAEAPAEGGDDTAPPGEGSPGG